MISIIIAIVSITENIDECNISINSELLADIAKYEYPDLINMSIMLFLDELYNTNKINYLHKFNKTELETLIEFSYHSNFQEILLMYSLDELTSFPLESATADELDKFIELYKISVENIIIENQKNN